MKNQILKIKNEWNDSIMNESTELSKENSLFTKLAANFQTELRLKLRQKNADLFLADIAKLESSLRQVLSEAIKQIDGGSNQELNTVALILVQLMKTGSSELVNQLLKRESEKGQANFVVPIVNMLGDTFGESDISPEILKFVAANEPSDIASLRKKESDTRYALELLSITKNAINIKRFCPIYDDFSELKPNQKHFYLEMYKSLSHYEKQRNQKFIQSELAR